VRGVSVGDKIPYKADWNLHWEENAAAPAPTAPQPPAEPPPAAAPTKPTRETVAARSAEQQALDAGKDDPRGYGSGPPKGLDMPSFIANLAKVIHDNAAKFGGVGMHVADAYAAMKEKYPSLPLDDFQRAAYQLFDDRTVVAPGGDPYGLDAHTQTEERLRALIPYGSKLMGYLKPGDGTAQAAASATANVAAPQSAAATAKPSSAPAQSFHPLPPAIEATKQQIEADKSHSGTLAEREAQVDEFLTSLRAKHSDDQLRQLAKLVTGRSGKGASSALKYLRDDMLATSRMDDSQKV
jgi:hypothetical protein